MRLIFGLIFSLFSISSAIGQHTITGQVINSNGENLEQASVFITSTYWADITDNKGKYTLENVADGTYTLKVSFVGYKSFEKEIVISGDKKIDVNLGKNILELEAIEINSSRLDDGAAFAYTNITNEDIEDENVGLDVPYLLRWTPSMVVTSDAGTGIGYTSIRLRGSDATSINVTINDIPLNDSESQGVFWVDLPDFMSSVDNVQIQRGVGTSTNGAGAFGGTVSLNTNKIHQNPYAHVNTSVGSFNTRKLGVNLGTGLLNNKYSVDARYSIIKSDGYIDRASADLNSWYFSAARLGKKSSLRLLAFSGKERTYQSWYGTPEAKANGDDAALLAHYNRNFYSRADSINLFESGRTYNFYTYDDQVDDYQQDHYQLHYTIQPTEKLKLKTSAFYTRGIGFFEEFKPGEDYAGYGLPIENITSGDLVRRRWLDNDYYGVILGSEFNINESMLLKIGGSATGYQGDHFGRVIAAEGISEFNKLNKYYEGYGGKSEINGYIKTDYNLDKFQVFLDLQSRIIDYEISGVDDDLTQLDIRRDFTFFNPKAGITYAISNKQDVYASYAIANREPKRADLIENIGKDIQHETLHDLEVGYRYKSGKVQFEWNNYYMRYDNQLVLTGNVDNSGNYLKTNVGKSSRLGAELSFTTALTEKLFWNINTTISSNKVEEYVEDLGLETPNIYSNTDIAYSPSLVIGNALQYNLPHGLEVELSSKYVGKQFLDNTSNEDRSLPAYSFSNLRLGYDWNPTFLGKVKLNATVFNIFDAKYSSNGYTFSYYADELVTENFVYPQAGIHFILGANIEF